VKRSNKNIVKNIKNVAAGNALSEPVMSLAVTSGQRSNNHGSNQKRSCPNFLVLILPAWGDAAK